MRFLLQRMLPFTLILVLAFSAFWWHRRPYQADFVLDKIIAAHPNDPVVHLTFSPDGQFLVTRGETERAVKVWRVKDGQLGYTIAVKALQPIYFTFSPDGTLLAIAYGDGAVRIFGATDGKLKHTFRYSVQGAWLGRIAFSPGGKLLAQTWDDVLRNDYRILVWEVPSGKLVRALILPSTATPAFGINFSSDGRYLVSAQQAILRQNYRISSHLLLSLWDTQSWRKRTLDFVSLLHPYSLVGHYETIAFLPDRQRLLVPISWAGKAFVLRLHPKQVERVFEVPTFPYALHPKSGVTIWQPECAIQNDMLALVERRGIAWLIYRAMSLPLPLPDYFKWRLERRLLMPKLRQTKQVIQCYRATDGRRMARLTYDAWEGWIYSLALSPDGRYLAAGFDSGKVVIWAKKR